MKDMRFQIDKMKHVREVIHRPGIGEDTRQALLGTCDVVLEILAERIRQIEEMQGKQDEQVERRIQKMDVRERRIEVLEMLQICANELENKTLFPNEWETEVVLYTNLSQGDTIQKNSSCLIREILKTLERK